MFFNVFFNDTFMIFYDHKKYEKSFKQLNKNKHWEITWNQ